MASVSMNMCSGGRLSITPSAAVGVDFQAPLMPFFEISIIFPGHILAYRYDSIETIHHLR